METERIKTLGKQIPIKEYNDGDPAVNGVYVVRCGEYCKIGHTCNLKNRMDTFRNANPNPVDVMLFMETDSHKALEANLHMIYKEKRHFREWFKMDNDDLLALLVVFENSWRKIIPKPKKVEPKILSAWNLRGNG